MICLEQITLSPLSLNSPRVAAGPIVRADHLAPRNLPQRGHRGGQGGQEEVREADHEVLPEPGKVPQPLHQEGRPHPARGECLKKPLLLAEGDIV